MKSLSIHSNNTILSIKSDISSSINHQIFKECPSFRDYLQMEDSNSSRICIDQNIGASSGQTDLILSFEQDNCPFELSDNSLNFEEENEDLKKTAMSQIFEIGL